MWFSVYIYIYIYYICDSIYSCIHLWSLKSIRISTCQSWTVRGWQPPKIRTKYTPQEMIGLEDYFRLDVIMFRRWSDLSCASVAQDDWGQGPPPHKKWSRKHSLYWLGLCQARQSCVPLTLLSTNFYESDTRNLQLICQWTGSIPLTTRSDTNVQH